MGQTESKPTEEAVQIHAGSVDWKDEDDTLDQKTEPAQHIFVPALPYVPGPEHGILSPFDPSSTVLPQGFQIGPIFKPLPVEIRFEKDVAVTLRDGVKIYVDVFRPVTTNPVPVIMAWAPYGKSAGTAPRTTGLYGLLGINNGMLSGLARFEGPDPAYWCAQGYAVCNPDPRGIAFSEGNIWFMGRQEGKDCYDLIEWLGCQSWSNGKVGMTGTSYLGWAQYFAAAEKPPHLAAINPCEGLSDCFRDLTTQGGMPDYAFLSRITVNFVGSGLREDIAAEATAYQNACSDIWKDKIPRWNQIEVPCYLVASFSNTLHSRGTLRAFRKIASTKKWLRVHNSMEWPDYYSTSSTADLKAFFDRYLRGMDNTWETTPQVRYAIHDFKGGDLINQPATQFPPTDVSYQKFYLDGRFRSLSPEPIATESLVTYDTQIYPSFASFAMTFTQQTVMVGYPKVHLFVEAKGADDMDLFIMVQKLDKFGNHLQQFVVPNQGPVIQDFTENGASILKYKGPHGRLRVSRRRF
jgi:predicted acyl esterase